MTNILLIEDDPMVCEMLTEYLQADLHAFVNFAATGPHGALLLKSYRFDLGVIDAALPGMDGMQLAELAANENTPVLLISGHPDFCRRCHAFGFPYVRKPFDLDVLHKEAIRIIGQARENIRRVKASAAAMHVRQLALAEVMAESRRLLAADRKIDP